MFALKSLGTKHVSRQTLLSVPRATRVAYSTDMKTETIPGQNPSAESPVAAAVSESSEASKSSPSPSSFFSRPQGSKASSSSNVSAMLHSMFSQSNARSPAFGSNTSNDSELFSSKEVKPTLPDPRYVPRTGTKAGRTVEVTSNVPLHFALRQLNSLNRQSEVKQTVRAQAFYEKPGKKLQRLKIERQKRKFNQNVKRMFELVSEARRKGY